MKEGLSVTVNLITKKEECLGNVLPKKETLSEVQWFSRRELLVPKG
jgi:hypothetical protein